METARLTCPMLSTRSTQLVHPRTHPPHIVVVDASLTGWCDDMPSFHHQDAPSPGACQPDMNADRSTSTNAFDGGRRKLISDNSNVKYNLRTRPSINTRQDPALTKSTNARFAGHMNAPKPRSHYRETGRPPRRTVSSTMSHVKTGIFF